MVKSKKPTMPARKKISHMTPCSKEADIATIKTEVEDLVKIVKVNGLQKAVTELNVVVPQLSESVNNLSGKVQSLLDNKIAIDTEKRVKFNAKERLIIVISTIAAVSTVVIMLAEVISKNGGA